jgi:hypothetical protein
MPERNPTPRGYSLFCDDIREEVNGKTSYVGAYNGSIIGYGPAPATLPKLCIAIFYMQAPTDESRPVKIKILFEHEGVETVLIEGDLPPEGFHAVPIEPLLTDPLLGANVNIVLSPFTIERDGLLKARAYYGDEEIKLGSIAVRNQPSVAEHG